MASTSASISTLERGDYQAVGASEGNREPSRWNRKALAGIVAVGAALTFVLVITLRGSGGPSDDAVGFDSAPEVKAIVDARLSGTTDAARPSPPEAHTRLGGWLMHAHTAQVSLTKTTTSTTFTSDLKPDEKRHDGNPCEDNEEIFLGLCYKTCSALTGGEFPVRGTPFTCCKGYPCDPTVEGQKVRGEVPCTGFDVSGKGDCPHKPGACLVDEEDFLGLCYKKCSILTNGTYAKRTASATCCKGEGLECLNFIYKDWTNAAFDVGGGKGDGDSLTPGNVHPPLSTLTEGTHFDHIHVTGVNLKPKEQMHDGNKCEDTEELFAGLCYAKCSILTDGKYHERESAFSCRNHEKNKMPGVTPCEGYDVNAHGGCPHSPGACLTDEELFLDVCYEKCSTLTKGKYPHRATSFTCCKEEGYDCLNLFANETTAETSYSFAISGGSVDRDPLTPEGIHGPMKILTEVA